MNSIITRYKDIMKIIVVLTIAMFVFTLLHILYIKTIKSPKKNVDKTIEMINVNYDVLKKELDDMDMRISKSENLSFDENVYKVDFYEKASDIYNKKLIEIKDIILSKLVDDDVKSELEYDIEKFLKDLKNDDEQQKRYYESTILASLNANINRYEKTKDKCYDVILDYRAVLDK